MCLVERPFLVSKLTFYSMLIFHMGKYELKEKGDSSEIVSSKYMVVFNILHF